ncbi:hypothetical protein D9A70_11705, partial [Streptococcus agalactiae]|uniref:hypothetical protein n=1 Tax=Streptococcus agalactiae TaxID=1311 RepID=UPI000F268513
MMGKVEGRKKRGCQRMRWLDSITDAMNTNLGKFREMVDNSLEKSLMMGKVEGRKKRGCQRMRWLDSITD